jgi:gem associated protein 2
MSQPCLPVSHHRKRKGQDDTPVVDFSNVDIYSIDASEYLSMVSQQAKNMPEVFVAAEDSDPETSSNMDETKRRRPCPKQNRVVPIDGSAASLSYLVSNRASLTAPPSNDYLPRNPIWQERITANFDRLRDYLEQCRAHGVGGKNHRISVPSMKDRSGWHVFCVGDHEASGNAGAYFDDDDNDDSDENDKKNGTTKTSCIGDEEEEVEEIPEWRRPGAIPPEGHAPSVSLICQMDQVMIRLVLSHLSYYGREGWSPATPQKSAWIYSLLARLEKPIHRDDAANLFGLLKKLTQLRATLLVHDNGTTMGGERTDLARVNVLILLIGVYFEQGGGTSMARKEDLKSG